MNVLAAVYRTLELTVAAKGIIADMLAHPVPVVSNFYGSESKARIAWSPAKHRFFTLFACC